MKENLLTLTILFIFIFKGYNQKLEGKWIRIDDDQTYSFPSCTIKEFGKNKVKIFSFDSLWTTVPIIIDQNRGTLTQGFANRNNEFKFEIINENILVEFHKEKEITEDTTFTKVFGQKYVRQRPTVINYPVDQILHKTYSHFLPSSFLRTHNIIKFKDDMCSKDQKELFTKLGIENSCDYYRIEKIDKTFFIVYYLKKDIRKWAMPIIEVNENNLLIYDPTFKSDFVRIDQIDMINTNEGKLYID